MHAHTHTHTDAHTDTYIRTHTDTQRQLGIASSTIYWPLMAVLFGISTVGLSMVDPNPDPNPNPKLKL